MQAANSETKKPEKRKHHESKARILKERRRRRGQEKPEEESDFESDSSVEPVDLHQDLAKSLEGKAATANPAPDPQPAKRTRTEELASVEKVFDSDSEEAKARQVHKAVFFCSGARRV